MTQAPMREINPQNPPEPLSEEARGEVAALARRQKRAGGLLMKAVNLLGTSVEDGMRLLPRAVRAQVDAAARGALLRSYDAAARSRARQGLFAGRLGAVAGLVRGDRAHKALAAASGALGGLGGLPTALAELPVATTVIFRAVQGVAEAHGEDPGAEETRLECIKVFGAGGPQAPEDGVNTAFVGARLSITGAAVNRLVARVAPRFGAVIGQKVMAQAVPLIGAAAGAGTNWAFIDYYVEVAHVHFGLRRLARVHGSEAVADEFHRVLAEGSVPVRRM